MPRLVLIDFLLRGVTEIIVRAAGGGTDAGPRIVFPVTRFGYFRADKRRQKQEEQILEIESL